MAATKEARAVAEEARSKAEAEASHLEVEQTSFLLEIGAAKDEVSSFHSQASKDKEITEEDYQKALEVIFFLWLLVLCFQNNINICGDQPEVPDGMPDSSDPLPPEFFVSPKCPPVLAAIEDTSVEAHPNKVAKEP